MNTISQFLMSSNFQFWTLLLVAGGFEITMAVHLKKSNGFTELRPSVIGVIAANLSILFLDLAARHAPISVAYPIWTGMGAFGSLVITRFYYQEKLKGYQPAFWAILVIGVMGLSFYASQPAQPPEPKHAQAIMLIFPLAAIGRFRIKNLRFWGLILIAGCFECFMALELKASNGWTEFWPSVLGIMGNNISVVFLTLASTRVKMSIAYPIWTGLGAVGSAALAVVVLGEEASPLLWASWTCTIIGLVGLAFYDE